MRTFETPIHLCAVALLFSGCGGTGLAEISGNVVYDGTPVQQGTIAFLPTDGAGPTAAGAVADGKYSVKIAPGRKRVQIEAFRIVGQRHHRNAPDSPLVDIREQILPDRYNARTELVREVTPENRVYDFALDK